MLVVLLTVGSSWRVPRCGVRSLAFNLGSIWNSYLGLTQGSGKVSVAVVEHLPLYVDIPHLVGSKESIELRVP